MDTNTGTETTNTETTTPPATPPCVRVDRTLRDVIYLTLRPTTFKCTHEISLIVDVTGRGQHEMSVGCATMTLAEWRGQQGDDAIEDEYGMDYSAYKRDEHIDRWKRIRDAVVTEAERIATAVAASLADPA